MPVSCHPPQNLYLPRPRVWLQAGTLKPRTRTAPRRLRLYALPCGLHAERGGRGEVRVRGPCQRDQAGADPTKPAVLKAHGTQPSPQLIERTNPTLHLPLRRETSHARSSREQPSERPRPDAPSPRLETAQRRRRRRARLTTLLGSLRWFSMQCFTSSCWSRLRAPQYGQTNVDRLGILLKAKRRVSRPQQRPEPQTPPKKSMAARF